MQIYAVGGWVRDALLAQGAQAQSTHLNLTAAPSGADRDWVVVGATPEQLLAQGFKPVGKDFPVFLHPVTHEEYALARTERKTAPGYHGFVFHAAPTVSLEQDLARRDLTINAIAVDAQGQITDPFNGRRDLQARVLRHVSPAFVEDPVRILRLARFAARFPTFTVAPATAALLSQMVAQGEADALVAERVLQELQLGLNAAQPSRMLAVLDACGLLARSYGELVHLTTTSAALDRAAATALPAAGRFALLASACANATALTTWLAKLRVDRAAAQLARLLFTQRTALATAHTAAQMLAVLEQTDALRRPERFALLLKTYAVLGPDAAALTRWQHALKAVQGLDLSALIAAHTGAPAALGLALQHARLERLQQALGQVL